MEGQVKYPNRTAISPQTSWTVSGRWLFVMGRWVIISQKLQKVILQKLHSEYMGIAKTKALAQSHVWWTGMDKRLGCFSKSCPVNPAVKQVSAVHLCIPRYGLAAPGKGSTWTYLDHFRVLYIDGCPVKMPQTSTARTITVLWQLISTHGIPEQNSDWQWITIYIRRLHQFVNSNGIQNFMSSPYHTALNGEAERLVRTFKEAMKASKIMDWLLLIE